MNEYHRRFWSLYLDFLQGFKSLKYAGIPLPYLSTFHIYIDDEVKRLIAEPDFIRCLNHRLQHESELQPALDQYLRRIDSDKALDAVNRTNISKGKLVLYTSLLFFPDSIFENFFAPSDLLVVVPKPLKTERFTGGIPYYPLAPYSTVQEKTVRKIMKQLEDLLRLHKRHPIFGRESFGRLFRNDISRFIGQIQAVSRLFAKNPVSCVILGTTNDSVSRLLALIAARDGIPSICMQHGLIGSEEGFLPVFTTKVAVYGKRDVKWFISKGLKADMLEEIGHPRFDCIFTELQQPRKAVLERLGVSEEKRIVLIATNPIRDLHSWSEYIDRLVAQMPSVVVLIKPHRNEIRRKMLEEYLALSERYPQVMLVPSDLNRLYDLIRSVHVVAVELSTVGLEAMLCGVPTVFLRKRDYSDLNHDYYYADMGEFVDTEPGRLAKLTERLLNKPKLKQKNIERMRSFAEDAYSVTLSAEALNELIRRLTSKSFKKHNSLPFEGKLIRGPDLRIFLVEKGLKRHFISMEAIRERGWQRKQIIPVSESTLAQIPSGPIIR